MTGLEVGALVGEFIAGAIKVAVEAMQGPPPSTAEELDKKLTDAMEARKGDRLRAAKEAADAEFAKASADAFGEPTKP